MGVLMGWEYERFNDYKSYDIHNNWGQIIQILTDNREKINKLLIWVRRTSGRARGLKLTKCIVNQGEILTPFSLDLAVGDTFLMFEDELFEYILEEGKIPPEHLAEYNYINIGKTEEEHVAWESDDKAQEEYYKADEIIRDKILDTIGFNNNHYLPIKWMAYGKNWWYNSRISLYLAKKLMPDGEWEVYKTDKHTTVFSAKYKLIFDLLVWGGLNAHASTYNMLFGNEYKPATDEEFSSRLTYWFSNEE